MPPLLHHLKATATVLLPLVPLVVAATLERPVQEEQQLRVGAARVATAAMTIMTMIMMQTVTMTMTAPMTMMMSMTMAMELQLACSTMTRKPWSVMLHGCCSAVHAHGKGEGKAAEMT